MKNKRGNLVAVLLILLSSFLYAQQDFHLELSPVFGTKIGTINEFVYHNTDTNNTKLSELNWDLSNAYYLGGKANLKFKNFSFDFSIAGFIPTKSGELLDSDWQNPSDSSMKTNFSISDNYLQESFFIDSNFSYSIPFVNFFELIFFTDFNYESLSFEGKDGEGWYGDNSIIVAWNDPKARHYKKGELGSITYEHNSYNLFFGLKPKFNINRFFQLELYGAISPFTYMEAIDSHYKPNKKDGATVYLDSGFTYFNSWNAGGSILVIPLKFLSLKMDASYNQTNFYKASTSTKYRDYYISRDTVLSGFSQSYLDLSLSVIYRPF